MFKPRWLSSNYATQLYDISINEAVLLIYKGLPVYDLDGVRVVEHPRLLDTYEQEPEYASTVLGSGMLKILDTGYLSDTSSRYYKFCDDRFYSDLRRGLYKFKTKEMESFAGFNTSSKDATTIQSEQRSTGQSCEDTPQHEHKAKRKHTRGAVTQAQAAALCQVSVRLFQEWEAGRNAPEGFPGRSDAMVLTAWANTYQGRQKLKEAAISMSRATSMDPRHLENMSDEDSPWG
ncbi:hypothetical protein NNJEOMEG_00159 [Fundidesulfovibrio magnetotacticus]|uniref:Uncharacterized protein n=1 Tax=Fundidesulfovibrio magnetotacticus TaxID=2730080 RepID=A0A6V8LVQ8_9BACT|nr:hypothetical protein [Fundidesulfovibrio magnetotacticus]GFK92335.1 hypothetical protein NNJEOMEG_00159 [Fundidesulfovibrio magnetotacticus]